MKKTVVVVACCSIVFCLAAKKREAQPDSLPHHKVLVISYHPDYYLSDAEQDIIKQSQMDVMLYRNEFRNGLDDELQNCISKLFPCITMLQTENYQGMEEFRKLVRTTNYAYAMPVVPKSLHKKEIISDKQKEEKTGLADSPSYSQPVEEKKFMNAVVADPAILQSLNKKFKTDIFVFINQFEIKTNFSRCLDLANRVYQRDLFVHYSVYDSQGKLLAGNVASVHFPSNSSRAGAIMHDCFPSIAAQVTVMVQGAIDNGINRGQ
jgi:hypothetical protein